MSTELLVKKELATSLVPEEFMCQVDGTRKGTRILYTSASIALAKLEVLANTSGSVPGLQALVTLEFPDDSSSILTIDTKRLPLNWSHFPYPAELAGITEHWTAESKHWILKVPSAQSPQEHNYLFNSQYLFHISLKIVEITSHEFDKRLIKHSHNYHLDLKEDR